MRVSLAPSPRHVMFVSPAIPIRPAAGPWSVWFLHAPQASEPSGKPPDALPAAEWTGTSWVGLLLYVFLFFLAAWWIYRLSGIKDSEPREGQG
jgi:hypothetical protein